MTKRSRRRTPLADLRAHRGVVDGFASSPADSAMRHIARRLGERLGQSVVVENRVGASGTLAATVVARAAPDGHTLLFGVAANLAVAPATMVKVPYDPVAAFAPIVEVARGPYLLLARADLPVRTAREFVDWARARPGQAISPRQGKAVPSTSRPSCCGAHSTCRCSTCPSPAACSMR